ncbi:hypothetical protein [Pontibacter flavimaris]|nr:hypothetical protein [Pontibacter flavimaris]
MIFHLRSESIPLIYTFYTSGNYNRDQTNLYFRRHHSALTWQRFSIL